MNIQDENSVTIQLGKKGLSETFYLEIAKNLRQNKLVKVKILKNAVANPDEKAEESEEESTSADSAESQPSEKKDRYFYSDAIISEIEKKHNIEHKLVGRTLFLKKINN